MYMTVDFDLPENINKFKAIELAEKNDISFSVLVPIGDNFLIMRIVKEENEEDKIKSFLLSVLTNEDISKVNEADVIEIYM